MRTSGPGNRSARHKGFTLFEVLVVLILVSLTVAVVMPSFSSSIKGLELETAGRDLITRMKQARSRAIAKQKVFRVILFKGEESPDYYILADAFEQEIGRFPMPEGISLERDGSEFPVKISFYPNGRSSGEFLVVRNLQGSQMSVSVDPVTGFAKVVKEGT